METGDDEVPPVDQNKEMPRQEKLTGPARFSWSQLYHEDGLLKPKTSIQQFVNKTTPLDPVTLEDLWGWRARQLEGESEFDIDERGFSRLLGRNLLVSEMKAMGIDLTLPKVQLMDLFFERAVRHWVTLSQAHARILVLCMRHGVTDSHRRDVWRLSVGSVARQTRYNNLYSKLKDAPSNNEKSIVRDMHRTFPNEPYFQDKEGEGQKALYNVLNAYASFDHKVGYAQGMAFVAGLLLLYMDEESAFWVFVSLMQEDMYQLRLLYGPGIGGFHLMIYQIDQLVTQYMPEVSDHLKKEFFGPDVYTPPFIPSLFIGRVPRNAGPRILDVFFSEGITVVPRLFLAMLTINKEVILSQPAECILNILNKYCETLTDDCGLDRLLELSFKFPVSFKTLQHLETEYWKKQAEKRDAEAATGSST